MASAEITTEKRTKRGDVLAVLGSSIPLGAWDPHRAVIAHEFPRRSGCWSATIFYDGGTLQEWNWIIIEEKTKEVKLMEKHATRFLHDTHGWIKIHVPWNKKEAIVDWKNKDYTGGGDTYVGTVDLIKARRIRLMEIRRWEETAEYRRQGRPVGCLLHSPTAMHQSPTPTPSPPSSKGSASPPKSTTPTESVGKTPRPAALKPAPAVTKAETGEGSVSSLEFGERSEDVMRNPEEKSSATGCPKAAAQSFADFKPLLRIKPYGDESGGRQQQRSVSPDRAAGKIQTKTIKAAQTAVEERGSISSRGSKAKCFPPLGDLFKRSSKGSTEQLVPEKTAEKPGRPTTKDAGKANVDMAALGFKGDKPADGDKKKCLVSEPGKPGYPRKSSEEMSGRTSESRDRPVAQAKSRAPDSPPQISPSQGVENYMCHTVQGREVWARGSSEFIPVGPSSSWGSTVGILYDPDKPRPAGSSRLAKLQKMTEQREQARAVERMEGIRQREERNRNKFHLDQKFGASPGPSLAFD
ncbi:hypothetical protein BaRGS_00027270 [Batillaria attramentaria]|uniref:CBM20 domain-containing protein n=1 Tax=Batillaria attramentaria TaxID=370345 RepID=A0ABD0K3G0_9CAEN